MFDTNTNTKYKLILMASTLFGTTYLFSISLINLNNKWNGFEERSFNYMDVLNTLIMTVTGVPLVKMITNLNMDK